MNSTQQHPTQTALDHCIVGEEPCNARRSAPQLACDLSDAEQRDLEPLEARLVELMRQDWLSPQDALRLAGCFSLSQRVSELKREHNLPIVDEWRQVGRSRFKCYRILESAA